ncbi:MAG: metallopeptidase TldD-related protein [Bacillota bacterium]
MISIEELKNKFDQAELLLKETDELKINLENWDLEDISSQKLLRNSLRVVKNGRRGANTAVGSSAKVEGSLISGAETSANFGEEMEFDFTSSELDQLSQGAREAFAAASSEEIFAYLEDFMARVREKKEDFTFNLRLHKELERIKVVTTQGGDLAEEKTSFTIFFGAPIPGGGSQLYRILESDNLFAEMPEAEIDDFIAEYEKTSTISVPKTGKMPVLFAPRALYFLPVSLQEGISARNIYQETSPLIDRLGDQIFSDKLTLTDSPARNNSSRHRSFDDEGIPTQQQAVISAGELKAYIYDLEYAARMDAEPKGNGLKQTMFGSGIDTPVTPALVNPVIKPGQTSKKEMIADIEEGILVEGIIGFHSSNYPQGQFSVQAHGFHVKNGQLHGRLQDVMIAGNIYEDFHNVRAVGDTLHSAFNGHYPYILVDDIMVTGS